MKRVRRMLAVLLILMFALTGTAPEAFAASSQQVEDYTVEKTDSGITVTLPAGYAEKGYWKLFWKDEASGRRSERRLCR